MPFRNFIFQVQIQIFTGKCTCCAPTLVQIPAGIVPCVVCVFSLSMHGFSPFPPIVLKRSSYRLIDYSKLSHGVHLFVWSCNGLATSSGCGSPLAPGTL